MPETHRSMFTNNYIESWHNQLKTVYFSRRRINRLDHLTFVLVNDVEFHFAEERERIMFNNGRMGPEQNEQAKRSFFVREVPANQLPSLIENPLGTNSSDVAIVNGNWFVGSLTSPSVKYSVSVEDGFISKCTCPDFRKKSLPCKHMYLLKRYTSVPLFYDRVKNDQLVAFITQEAIQIDEEGIAFKNENKTAQQNGLTSCFS